TNGRPTWSPVYLRFRHSLSPGGRGGHGYQQFVEPLHERSRILELATLRQQGLVEQDVAPVRKALLIGLMFQTLHQWMARIDFQNGLAARHRLTRGFEHALEVGAHAMLVRHKASGRRGEAECRAHLFDLIAEAFAYFIDELFVLASFFLLLLLV